MKCPRRWRKGIGKKASGQRVGRELPRKSGVSKGKRSTSHERGRRSIKKGTDWPPSSHDHASDISRTIQLFWLRKVCSFQKRGLLPLLFLHSPSLHRTLLRLSLRAELFRCDTNHIALPPSRPPSLLPSLPACLHPTSFFTCPESTTMHAPFSSFSSLSPVSPRVYLELSQEHIRG